MAQTRKEFKIISKFEKLQIDTFAYRWIKGQEREPSIHSISTYIRGRRLNIPSENFIQAWKLIQEHGNLFEKER